MKVTRIYHPEKSRVAKRGVLRVAAYCRVSTKSEDQLNSFEAQQTVYTEMINAHKGWELVDIYADRGITGRSAGKRKQFLRMIQDCENGLIDCVICKSLSRFARSTKDSLFYIRKLRELGIRVIFEKEDIDTDNTYSEMTLTVLAAFAEEESRSLSENIKWSHRIKARAGEPPLPRLYGYCRSGDNYEVVPEEAETIRLMFDLYEHGTVSQRIADMLSEMGIPTPKGNARWNEGSVRQMLENMKYMGDCQTQLTYMDGLRSRKNCGELPSVYIKNHHEAIITRKQFHRCRNIMRLRNCTGPIKYPFGEYLRCPHCGHVLYFRSRKPYIHYFYCDDEQGGTACRKFAVHSDLVKSAVLKAYDSIDMDAVQRLAESDDPEISTWAGTMLKTKEEHPSFEKVDYWWLDELVREIRFGQHKLYGTADEKPGGDDRTTSVVWKCGITTTVPSGVKEDPGKKAEELILRLARKSPEQTDRGYA